MFKFLNFKFLIFSNFLKVECKSIRVEWSEVEGVSIRVEWRGV